MLKIMALTTQVKHKALSGMTVIITRAAGQAPELARRLRAEDAKPIALPVIELRPPHSFQPLDSALRHLSRYDWLILTSVNGVAAFFRRLRRLEIPRSSLRGIKIAAIGPATRAAIERRGLRVHITPPEYVAEAVVRALKKGIAGKRVLLVRAAVARDVIPRELRRAGAHVDVVAAYETTLPLRARRQVNELFHRSAVRPDVITFTSSSTVCNFLKAASPRIRKELRQVALASIGPVTTATLRKHGLRATIQAQDYTIEGLCRAIVRWAKNKRC
jgi:uroporphyrinogen-III synthase